MEFNVNPYYDDFEQNAANNNYMRIMFKPGYAVQARELTQIQSILQNQIKRFGDHIFQDGSPVIGGNLTLDNKAKFLKLQETYNNEDVEVENFDGKIIRSADGLVQAKVVTTYYPSDGTPTLLLKYITSNEFAEGGVIKVAGETTQAQALTTNSNGSALVCSINEGVFYVDGFFVKVLDQSTPVNPYGVSANVKIGLEIDDTFVDSDVDTTLLDPAQGSFNYQAPGADRYQFSLRLSTRPLDSVVDESQFFELMRVENGAITKQIKYPIYSELEKTLARRTFDESGDYIVRPFRATILDGANANNYTLSIEPGKAYVKGFEFETIGTVKVDVPKPRSASDVKSFVDIDVDTSYGAFVYATSFRGSNGGFVNIAALEKFDIHCVGTANVNANIGLQTTSNTFYYGNTKIGTARLKNFVRYSADGFNAVTDSNGVYKLYLSDIDINPIVAKVTGASSNANTIRLTDKFSPSDNAYLNVSVTILPVRLDAVGDVYATVEANKFTVNANNSGTFAGKVNVGDTIRVGEFVREVTGVATGNLTVNSAFAYTVANSATNPVQVYVQQSYSQNVGGQSRNIIRYNGTTRTAFFDAPFDNDGVADVNTVFQLNFGIDDAKSFVAGPAVANTLNCTTLQNTAMNVASFGTLSNGDTFVEDPERGTLIFKLPGTYVSRTSLNNVDYFYNKFVPSRANNGTAGEFTLSQGSGLDSFETIPWADSTSAIQDNLIFVVRNNNGNTSYPNGTILQLTSANVTIGSPATTFTVNTAVPDILAVDIFVNVKVNDAEDLIRNKVFYSNTQYSYTSFNYPTSNALANVTVTLANLGEVAKIDMANGLAWLTNPTYNNVRPGDSISLFVPDVVKVRRIMQSNNTVVPQGDANTSDITTRFLIDYGQKDDRYDHAKLVLKSGADSPTGMLLVHFDYYHHIYATGANVSFFSPASYSSTQYDAGTIPVYTSGNGTIYELRDCLDFRPTLPVGAVNDTYTVPNITFPDETTELSFDHYLGRIDKLVLSKDKEFRVVQGKSAVIPYPPEDLDDAMTLFVVNVPPYAADIRQVGLRYIDNRRLTMKELASLSKRVDRLEQFTSLNNVENIAMSDPTQYADGTDKEKFGIVGENFTNFNIADFKNPDFAAAVDGGYLIPEMENRPLSFKDYVRTNTKKNLRTLSLNYTETPAVTQNVASNSVKISPFLFGRFNGIVDLTPETDFWCSDVLKPEVIAEPSPIVEQPRVIRDFVIEDVDVPTIRFISIDAGTLIIDSPNIDPPGNTAANTVVAPVEPPPPVIPSDPAPPDDPPPTPPSVQPPVDPPIIFDPTQPIDPLAGDVIPSIWVNGGSDLFVPIDIVHQNQLSEDSQPESSIPTGSQPITASASGGNRSEFDRFRQERD